MTESRYNRRDGEDKYEYGLRLISMKVEENPNDLDWQDIVDLLELNCHRDSLRKAANVTLYSGYSVMQYFKEKYAENPYKDDMDNKINELRLERQRLFDQRREFNKTQTWTARSEHLENMLISAANNLPRYEQKKDSDGDYDRQDPQCEAVVVLADWHYGMTANNVWNKFDTDICVSRVLRLIKGVTERLQLHNISKLSIVLLGDMAHGAIHVSSRVSSEELVCDQLMQVSELLAMTISRMADFAGETVVYSTYGNHLRTVQNSNDSIHRDNMERLIPWWLRLRLKERRDITFSSPSENEFVDFTVCRRNICAVHGDLDRIRQSPQSLNTLYTKKYGKALDYILLADKHHAEEYEEFGIEAITVGSLCGTDEYANTKRLYSEPSQLLLIFNDKDGKDATYNVKVRDS